MNAVNESLNADKVVFNYSNVILSQKLENLLVKGLRFGIPPSKLNFTNFLLSFEKLLKSLLQHKLSSNFSENVKSSIKNLVFSTFYSYKQEILDGGIKK